MPSISSSFDREFHGSYSILLTDAISDELTIFYDGDSIAG
jgi:hypothetical protein